MLIVLFEGMTGTDLGFIRSKAKVTRVLFIKQWLPLIIMNIIYHRAVLFHMLIGHGEALTPFDFGLTRF